MSNEQGFVLKAGQPLFCGDTDGYLKAYFSFDRGDGKEHKVLIASIGAGILTDEDLREAFIDLVKKTVERVVSQMLDEAGAGEKQSFWAATLDDAAQQAEMAVAERSPKH